jgi:hypothetical protein
VDTSEIRYRVADFLKQHPPFTAVDDTDLVALAADGRVRFFPNHEFLAWQGEPHKMHVLVIQQGTVSLWDEQGSQAELRDVRGPGDWIGAEQFHGARSCLYTVRATTDVVTYGFPVADDRGAAREVSRTRLVRRGDGIGGQHVHARTRAANRCPCICRQLAGPLSSCGRETTVRAPRSCCSRAAPEALAVTDDNGVCHGVVTRATAGVDRVGHGDADRADSEIGLAVPGVAGPTRPSPRARCGWRRAAPSP